MPDYKETTVNGTQWQRCCAIHISNPYGRTPQITLQEERLTTINGELFQQSAGGINLDFDPEAEIPLLNTATGEPLGWSMSQGELHAALWSLYMMKAAERDAAQG